MPPRLAREVYSEPCRFPGCPNRTHLRSSGLCQAHYNQQYFGKELRPIRRVLTIEEKLESKKSIDHETGCWLWTGHVDTPGYGDFKLRNKTYKVHRAAFELWVGPIEGDTIHHKCAVRHCFNPDHLQRATHRDNSLEMHERRAFRSRIKFLERRVADLEAQMA